MTGRNQIYVTLSRIIKGQEHFYQIHVILGIIIHTFPEQSSVKYILRNIGEGLLPKN